MHSTNKLHNVLVQTIIDVKSALDKRKISISGGKCGLLQNELFGLCFVFIVVTQLKYILRLPMNIYHTDRKLVLKNLNQVFL